MRIFKVIRLRLKLTQAEMAKLLGMQVAAYSHLERNQKNTSHGKLNKLKLLSGLGPEFWALYEKEGDK